MRLRDGDPYGYNGEPLVGDALDMVLARGAEAFGWDEARAKRRSGAVRRGVGVAAAAWKSGVVGKGPDHSAASVVIETDGTVTLSTAAADLGTGVRTTLGQICAEALGVPLDLVRLSPIDTDVTPYDSGAFASRSLYRNGQAVRLAAAEARRQVLDFASELMEIAVDDLELRDGEVVAHGVPEKLLALPALLREGLRAGRMFQGFGQAPRSNAPTFSAAFAEVVVDTDTGEVRVARVLAVQDVGRAINPQIVEGQIQGAIHQGIGYALSEGLVVDADSGTVINGTYMDYRLLTSADSPPIDVLLVEEADGTGPYGAKGIAEPGIVVAAPAIANAILHATGASVRDLPMTPERVLFALDEH
jgi:xanthine dehydrogenase molybdenum-binding subunit